MIDPSREAQGQEIEQQTRQVRGLMAALYDRNDAAPDESLLRDLAAAKKTLSELQVQRDAERAKTENTQAGSKRTMDIPLGPETTGLRVVTRARLQLIPTGVYHLLDPETDPLLAVAVKNESHEPRRVCVSAFIEGLSARAIKTVGLGRIECVGETLKMILISEMSTSDLQQKLQHNPWKP